MAKENKVYDVLIIGAGIAGMTAAIYARRANKSVLILEAKISGGQIVNATDVRNWPGEERISGEKLSEKIYHQMNNYGVDFRYETVEKMRAADKLFEIQTDEGEYQGRSLIIATGSRDKELGVKNEKALVGHGLSYCVTCDGELFKGQDVAVVGGGNTAMYDVMYLANLAQKVYLVHRRKEFRADAALVEQVQRLKNVEIITNAQFNLICHDDKIVGFTAIDKNLSATTYIKPVLFPIAAVFVAIGRTPETEMVRDLVDLDRKGYIVAGEDCHTSQPGVFAAGDCRTKQVRQLVTAASDGAAAATAAVEYLNSQE